MYVRSAAFSSDPDLVYRCRAPFGKNVGALPCLNTIAQLLDCLRTQSCHRRQH